MRRVSVPSTTPRVKIDRLERAPVYWFFALERDLRSSVPRAIPRAAASSLVSRLQEFPKATTLKEPRVRSADRSKTMNSNVKATQLRPGMVIQHEGQLFTVFSTDHRTPGNKRGSMQTRMKNLRTGAIIDYRFRAEEFIERAILDEIEFEYLYNEGDDFHFMNTETYEQMQLSREELGETVYYLIPNTVVKVEFFEDKAIGVDLPDTMELRVVQTEPTLQKATASAVGKPATLETGLVVQVPPFVNEGDRIKVDTSEARYVQRVE
jgi:elongation factor P